MNEAHTQPTLNLALAPTKARFAGECGWSDDGEPEYLGRVGTERTNRGL
jgi:hypothetical protein